ncbi:alpha/beta hydrolase [Methylobacterium sp. J-030]|uniref:alpha/beta fold hydrolase n=1 Tax=Methylobacterium sp. J-030 TaxID=2836627 RepID=UPI001FBB0937|nr:alpha/beta hydrolase [Methylobacterium sp. J-030]MCJ2067258.1 alpha/beta hydrolase [Methylobacterium sp. J-030]
MHIVLIPGFMADASLWDGIVQDVGILGPLVYGDLSRATSIREMAQHVLDDAPEHFSLIGFSMGGYVAREIVRIAPERVTALVLVATSARADTVEQARRKASAVRLMDPTRFTGFSRSGVLSSLHPDRAGDEAMIERVRAMSERVGAEVFRRHASQDRPSDLHLLNSIQCPTLVIAADQDALRSIGEAQELRDGINGAKLIIIENSGHMIPIERPKALADAVVPWLRDQDLLLEGG